MALDSSGALALSEIQTEFGGSNPIGMSEYYGDGDYVPDGSADGDGNAIPESGAIDISDFYDTSNIAYIDASGGSESNSGDYTFNTYTSSGTFNVASTGVGTGNNTVDYLVVAGGGAGGGSLGGGGGAGGSGYGPEGSNGTANTGGGGGGGSHGTSGSTGGSGIVVLRYIDGAFSMLTGSLYVADTLSNFRIVFIYLLRKLKNL